MKNIKDTGYNRTNPLSEAILAPHYISPSVVPHESAGVPKIKIMK